VTISVQTLDTKTDQWDNYARKHPQSNLYHLSGWKEIIEKTYSHKTYYLMAIKSGQFPDSTGLTKVKNPINTNGPVDSKIVDTDIIKSSKGYGPLAMSHECYDRSDSKLKSKHRFPSGSLVSGILPMVYIKHLLFGSNLISIPYFDLGGILADDEATEHTLLSEAIKIAHNVGAETIELRNIEPLGILRAEGSPLKYSSDFAGQAKLKAQSNIANSTNPTGAINAVTRTQKVRMTRELPDSSERLMKSFKSKLRSQIRKPLKKGLIYKVGGMELLDDFYEVFARNMRDLGSPVHTKRLMEAVLLVFPDISRVIVVYLEDRPLACSIVIGFEDTLENPWASSLREYSKLAPNMLLYWAMLEYACDNGFRYFDFGRSTPNESTFKFKKQWGAEPHPLHWHYIPVNGKPIDTTETENSKFNNAIQIWKKLPVRLTRIIGPKIRKYISL
jgi:FemAB-related protein (PEP-CTERM system-associated)